MQQQESLIPLDIILPAHGRLELTKHAVDCIYSNTHSPFHLIVMDDSDASVREGAFHPIEVGDTTSDYFNQLTKVTPNITYYNSPHPFKNGNEFFNKAFEFCKYDFVATTMNSLRVEPDWEKVALRLMKDDPTIGMVGLKNLFPNGLIESAGIIMAGHTPTDFGRDQAGHRLNQIIEMEAVQWAFAIVRLKAVVGALDTSFHGFVGWDDIDNCFELKKRGWKIVYCGMGVGYHAPRATRGDNRVEAFMLNKENAEKFYKKWGYWEMYKGANRMDIGDKLSDETKSYLLETVMEYQVINRLREERLAKLEVAGDKALTEAKMSHTEYQLTVDPVMRQFMVTPKLNSEVPKLDGEPSDNGERKVSPREVIV